MAWCTAALCAAVLAVIICSVFLIHYRRSLQRTRGELARLRTFHEERMRRPNVLSHELRTPLTVVRGAAELLLDESAGPLNPDQKRFIQTIAENSNQVIDMASDLLAEASLESDLFNLRLEWTEMRCSVAPGSQRVHPPGQPRGAAAHPSGPSPDGTGRYERC